MTDKFKAVMDNDCFTTSDKYWKVEIQTNDLNVLNNICSALNLIRNNENNNISSNKTKEVYPLHEEGKEYVG